MRPSHPDSAREPHRSLIERLSVAVDERVGIIHSLEELQLPQPFDGVIAGFSAPVGRLTDLHPTKLQLLEPSGVAGYGTAIDRELAQVRALSEALERYCALMPPRPDEVVHERADELGADALDLRVLPRCSSDERARAAPANRLQQPDAEAVLPWIRAYSVTRSVELWVPLTITYLGLPLPLSSHLAFPMSTGFAAGSTYSQAVLAGLCEVIERDSLALWWLHQLPFSRLHRNAWAADGVQALAGRLRNYGIETVLFDLTTDVGVPVIGMVQCSIRTFPHVVTMAACRLEAEAAVLRVLEESASLRVAITMAKETSTGFGALLAGDPQPAEVFALYHAGQHGPERFRNLLGSARVSEALPQSISSVQPLQAIVANLRRLGMEVIVLDVTVDEVRDLGLVVVRVIVPQLMPLSFSHSVRYLGHPRLYDLPARMGFGERIESDITRDPIPYA